MYLYNTTFGIDHTIQSDVLDWLKHRFIPSAEEYFSMPEVMKVLGDEPSSTSLAVHFRCSDISDINNWYADHGSRLFNEAQDNWPEKIAFFSTVLEIL